MFGLDDDDEISCLTLRGDALAVFVQIGVFWTRVAAFGCKKHDAFFSQNLDISKMYYDPFFDLFEEIFEFILYNIIIPDIWIFVRIYYGCIL